jgi:ABC-2 type transport system ATP-binding protein
MTGPPLLEAHRLTKRFHGVTVVNNVSFAIRPGEVVGYLGPNGSGKTTTFRMLTGLLEPSDGSVLFEGRPLDSVWDEFRRRIGYVPEEPSVYRFLSGHEYLELVAALRQMPPAHSKRRLEPLAELFGVSGALEQPLSSYSKGMTQKILLIAALLHNPDLLILDEPESGLDILSGLVIRQLVLELAGRGKAILYSSHVLESVEKTCDRVIVLYRGRIVADDSVQRVCRDTASKSLEEVFAQLAQSPEPQRTAAQIADVIAGNV